MMPNKLIISLGLMGLALMACSNDSAEQSATSPSSTKEIPAATPATTVAEQMTQAETPAPTEPVVAAEVAPAEDPQPPAVEQSSPAATEPQEHIVKGVITQWQPLVTFAQPGDRIKFTNMAGHDTASMEGMIPEGAAAWQSKLGEEAFTITVEKEGAYVYKCNPHITTGMVGIIIVGDRNPDNLAQLEENAGKVKIGGNMVKRAIRKMKKQLESS